MKYFGVLLFGAVGCYTVAPVDQVALQEAARLNAAAYEHVDGGADRALVRGSFCAIEGILERNKIDGGVPNAGIQCAP